MLRSGRRWIGGSLVRGGGQVAVSVAATMIATALFTVLRPADPPAAAPSPALTSGGKFGVRIAGAEAEPLAAAEPPRLSIVDWAITPSRPLVPVADIAWRDPDAGLGADGAITPLRPTQLVTDVAWRPTRANAEDRVRPGIEARPVVQRAPRRPVAAAAAPVPPLTPAAEKASAAPLAPAEPSHGMLASATGAVLSVASGTSHAVMSAGGGAVRLGAAALDRIAGLIP